MDVDFNEVNRNIKKDHLDLKLIRIIYEELTELEVMEILKYQGGENLEDGKILGYYPDNMEPLYKEKVKGVLYLGTE